MSSAPHSKHDPKVSRIHEIVDGHPDFRHVSSERIEQIREEFERGFAFLQSIPEDSVSVFGSARCRPGSEAYQEAEELGRGLAKQGFAIVTGGGPGIMEAANKGAAEAGGRSAGLGIQLPEEQKINPYVQESVSFHHFFVRKVMLAFTAEVYVFFPGGFGTMDEFFELVTLVQTRKTNPIPIILVGKEYWTPLLAWIEETLFEKNGAIDQEDMKIYTLVDSAEEVLKLTEGLFG